VVVEAERLGGPLPEGATCAALLGWGEDITPPVIRLGSKTYRLTAGRVGGPEKEAPSREIAAALVRRVLEAALGGLVEWETDPDFGFDVPAAVPGVAADDLLTLVPRFLYARTDRVYEYAAMVPERRDEMAALAANG
jgi:ATP-dependent phosphoenolpyruvate carboxykinase